MATAPLAGGGHVNVSRRGAPASAPLHADYFGRKTDEQFAEYCASKPHNARSIDGLPALPLPLPARDS